MFRTSHARHVSAAGFLLAFSGLATTIVPLPVLAADQNEGPSEKLYYDLRDEIPTEFRWDLQAIYPDVEAWEAKLEAVEAAVPGIGAYTAAAIGSIAFGVVTPAIDGNVERVISRLLGIAGDPRRGRGRRASRLPRSPGRSRWRRRRSSG